MSTPEFEELVSKGLLAFSNGHTYLAMNCLEAANRLEHSSIVASYLAYCLAVNRTAFDEAITLGREALAEEPNNPVFCLNLGRVYLLAGQKDEAIKTLRQGLVFCRDEQIIAELNAMGTRKRSVVPWLHRNHPLNKYLGLLLHRVGLR
jgi:tetratricopeptide (TPR) repeat protein